MSSDCSESTLSVHDGRNTQVLLQFELSLVNDVTSVSVLLLLTKNRLYDVKLPCFDRKPFCDSVHLHCSNYNYLGNPVAAT